MTSKGLKRKYTFLARWARLACISVWGSKGSGTKFGNSRVIEIFAAEQGILMMGLSQLLLLIIAVRHSLLKEC
jgi:hypothetical protein